MSTGKGPTEIEFIQANIDRMKPDWISGLTNGSLHGG